MLGVSRRLISTCQPSAAETAVRAMGAAANDAKRRILRIGTHSGTFHCDEALGCFLLQQVSAHHCTTPPPPSRARQHWLCVRLVTLETSAAPACTSGAVLSAGPNKPCLLHRERRSSPPLQTAAFKGAEVVRSRNPEVLKDLDVIIDVGATYEPGASQPCMRLSPCRTQSCQAISYLHSRPSIPNCWLLFDPLSWTADHASWP